MSIAVLCGAFALLIAASRDLLHRTIPDFSVALTALAGLSLRFDGGLQFFAVSLGIALLLFMAMTFLFHLGAVGGGDVKLLTAASLLVPPAFVPGQIFLISLAGGVLALIWLLHGKLRGRETPPPGLTCHVASQNDAPAASSDAPKEPEFEDGGLPYGIAICAGTLIQLAVLP